LKLSLFNASVNGDKILLKWRTITEINNSGWEIERNYPQININNWHNIGFVKGAGNSQVEKNYLFRDIVTSKKCRYRLKQIDYNGTLKYSEVVSVETNIDNLNYSLSQNYPNPFNPSTKINIFLPVSAHVELIIYNVLGKVVRKIIDNRMEAGNSEFNFLSGEMPGGIYFYKVRANGEDGSSFTDVKRMLIIK